MRNNHASIKHKQKKRDSQYEYINTLYVLKNSGPLLEVIYWYR